MRDAVRLESRPSSPLTAAAAPFTRASQCTTATGTVSPEIGKFSTALAVSAPHSCPRRLTRALSPNGSARFRPRGYERGAAAATARGVLRAKGDELARHADGVVVGDQKAR